MASALMNVFDAHVAQLILDMVPEDRDPELETVYGFVFIDGVKHLLTHGGGPEGGYVYFFERRDRGWYRWHRTWGQEATYERVVDGNVGFFLNDDGGEYIRVITDNCWSFWGSLADNVYVADDQWMDDTTPYDERDKYDENDEN